MKYKLLKNENIVNIDNLRPTNTFLYGGILYMKLPSCKDVSGYSPHTSYLKEVNAINLESGTLWFISNEYELEKVDGMFVEGAE